MYGRRVANKIYQEIGLCLASHPNGHRSESHSPILSGLYYFFPALHARTIYFGSGSIDIILGSWISQYHLVTPPFRALFEAVLRVGMLVYICGQMSCRECRIKTPTDHTGRYIIDARYFQLPIALLVSESITSWPPCLRTK
jgi:hypothetical protein